MKPGLLILILAVSSAGWGWSEDLAAFKARWNKRLVSHLESIGMAELSRMGEPIPLSPQLPTHSSDEQPMMTAELDGRLYVPDELSLLYVPSIDPLNGWDQDNGAWIKTEALALTSGLMRINDESALYGAHWIRHRPFREPRVVPSWDSTSARKSLLPPSWLKSLPVPLDIRSSLIERLSLYQSYWSPFFVSRDFVPRQFLKPFSPP